MADQQAGRAEQFSQMQVRNDSAVGDRAVGVGDVMTFAFRVRAYYACALNLINLCQKQQCLASGLVEVLNHELRLKNHHHLVILIF
jgi:hypothetical protein